MLYNVAQMLREPAGATREYTLDEGVTFGDEQTWGKIRICGVLHLLRTLTGVLATGDLRTAIDEECARCLEHYHQPLMLALEDEFYPQMDPDTGVTVAIPESQFAIDEHHVLDLTEAIRQAVLINRPIQPLCRPDCQGLCPECGVNRNLHACDCAAPAVDPRWAKLKAMLS